MANENIDVPDENFQRRSVADFFHDNKAIAGFDNSMRVVFTSVRELVENGLDAAEKILRLPSIEVSIELLSSQEIATLLGIDKYSKKDKGHQDFIRLTVKDNGSGVPQKEVADLFGRVLTGSNYGVRQSRGRFGLGAKMVLLNAMATVDLPIVVKSRHMKEKLTSEHHLFINLQKNEPKITFTKTYNKTDTENYFKESGTLVSVTFTGSWNLAKRYVKEYFHQLSIITPYSSFEIKLPDEEISLPRVIDHLPAYPSTMKIHPKGCDITALKREIAYTKAETMIEFLSSHFEGITKKKAQEFLKFINLENKDPRKLTSSDIRRIVHDGFLAQESDDKKKKKKVKKKKVFNFTRASGKGLSPLGEDRLKRGLAKELDPFLVEATTRPVNSYSGHAFIIEAAVAYGGKTLDEEQDESGRSVIRIYRFANRIPLLFGAGNDVITKTINDSSMVPWKDYKINLNTSPIAIAVSLVSTKIPFPETSKEYLADVKEIRIEIAEALKTLGAKLRTHLSRRERADRERQRKSRFEKFAPVVSEAVLEILEENEEQPYELNNLSVLLSRALVEGTPKSAQHRKPPSPSIRTIKYWINYPENRREKLDEMNVITLADFLATPDDKLVLKSLPIERVREIKRISIEALDEKIDTPRITILELFPDEIESGFTEFEKITKALSRRWMTTVYDFFVTKSEDFLKVRGFNEKLWAIYKRRILKRLKDENLLNSNAYQLTTIPWMNDEILDDFNASGIRNIPTFLISFPNLLLNTKKFNSFHNFMLKYIKKDIKKNIEDRQSNLNANMVVWLSGNAKKALNVKKLKSWQDLIDTINSTPKTILSNTELLTGIINNLKYKIIEKYNASSDHILITTIAELPQETLKALKKQKIVTLFDLLIKNKFPDTSLFLKVFNEFRNNKLHKWNSLGKVPLVNELVWIPADIEEQLNKNGIFTIYEFLITPTNKLYEFTNKTVSMDIIKEIKQQYGIPINYVSSELRDKLNKHGIITTEELMNLNEEEPLYSKISPIQDTLNSPIVCLPDLPFDKLNSLYHMGVRTVYDFLIWPETELTKIIPHIQMFNIKNKIDLNAIGSLANKHTKKLNQFAFLHKKSIKLLEKIGIINVEDVLFKNSFKVEFILSEHQIGVKKRPEFIEALNTLRRELLSPIVFLPAFKFTKIKRVLAKNIRTIMEFIYWPADDLESLFDPGTDISGLQNSISELKKGIPLDKTKFFAASELNALKSEHIRYLEEIYFTLNRHTFAVPRVDWARIRDTKSLLNLPVGLIVFSESIESIDDQGNKITVLIDKPISHSLVVQLNKAEIHTILEFLLVPPKYLASHLNISETEAKDIQNRLKIKSEEEKLELNEKILGCPKSFIRELDSAGITTLESLYFASEEVLEENPKLVKTIENFKRTLESPLRLIDLFTPKIREKLAERNIFTFATFLMFPSNELAKIMDISEERVEETFKLGPKLDIFKLNQILSNSLTIITDLPSHTIMELRKKGITSVGHLLSIPKDKIELFSNDKQVFKVYNSITPSEIEIYSSQAITGLERYFSKSNTKKIVKAGYASIQEIIYFANIDDFDDPSVWDDISSLKAVLNADAKHFCPLEFMDIITQLSKLGYRKLIDIMNLNLESIPKGLKLTKDDLALVLENFDVTKLKKVTNIPLSIIPSLDEVIKQKLKDSPINPINSLGDLITTAVPVLENILNVSKKDIDLILDDIDIPGLIKILDISPQFILNLEAPQFLTLSRKRITKLLDIITMDRSELAKILDLQLSTTNQIIEDIDWEGFNSILNSNIATIYNLPSNWKKKLLLSGITTLKSFLFSSDKNLSNILGYAERTVSSHKNLSLRSILSLREKQQDWSNLLEFFYQAKYLGNQGDIEFQGVKLASNEFIKIIELPLANFDILEAETRKILEDNGILTIFDIISYNLDDLKKLKKLSEEAVKQIYDSVKLPALTTGFKEPSNISDYPIINKTIYNKLKKHSLTSVESIFTLVEQSSNLPEDIKDDLPRVYRALFHPTILLPNLTLAEKYTLIDHGLINFNNMMRKETSELSDIIGKPLPSLEKYLNSLTIQKLEKERISSGNLITSLNGLTENVIKAINNAVKFKDITFEELCFSQINMALNKSDQNHVDKLIEIYTAPILYHYLLVEEHTLEVKKFVDKGFKHIFSTLIYSGSKLASILEIDDKITRKLRYNLDLNKAKKYARKEGLKIEQQLSNLLNISTKELDSVQSAGFTTWQSLVFPNLFQLNPEQRDIVIKVSNQILQLFDIPINRLEGIKISRVPLLKGKGITSIGMFLLGPSKLVKETGKLSASDYNAIRSHPKLSTKLQVTHTLDRILEKAKQAKIEKETIPHKTLTKKISKRTSKKNRSSKLTTKTRTVSAQGKFTPPRNKKKKIVEKAIKTTKSSKKLPIGKTPSKKSSRKKSSRRK